MATVKSTKKGNYCINKWGVNILCSRQYVLDDYIIQKTVSRGTLLYY